MVGAASHGRPTVYHFKERTTRPLMPLIRSIPHTSDYFPSTGLFNVRKIEQNTCQSSREKAVPGCSILLIRYLEPR